MEWRNNGVMEYEKGGVAGSNPVLRYSSTPTPQINSLEV